MTGLVAWLLSRLFPWLVRARRVYRHIARPVTVGVRALIVQDGQVLLVRQHGRATWELPGGGVGRGESLRAAAVREAREETGIEVVAERLLGVYSAMVEGMSNHVAVYVCRPTEAGRGQPTVQANLEIAEARYWPLDALPPVADRNFAQRLREYASGGSGFDGAL